ncbi:hypothetical protein BH23ACT5_BH23ACT5_11050 [soil metagenome]
MTHDPHRETHTERSTIVTTTGGGGGPGLIIGAILAVLVVVLIVWLVFVRGDIDPAGPTDEVNVTIDIDDNTGGADEGDAPTETTPPADEGTTETTGG